MNVLISIQYLRAVAALAVVALHTGWTHTRVGNAGVDVFFVISGFIMMLVSRREGAPHAFLWARIVRVVPLYWIATFITIATAGASFRNAFLSLMFIPYYNSKSEIEPLLHVGWTLNYEAFFYVAFAAALLIGFRWRLPALTAAFGALVGVGAVVHPASAALTIYTNPLILEFLAGAWVWTAWRSGRIPQGRLALLCVVVGVVGMAAATLTGDSHELRAVFWGPPAVLVVAGAIGLEARLPRHPWLLLLGDASYALYITHVPLRTLVRPWAASLPLPLALVVLIGSSVALAVIVHRLVEKPLTDLLRGRRPRNVGGASAITDAQVEAG